MSKHTVQDLYQMQSLSLQSKIAMTMTRIKGWINEYGEDCVYVSFSGGKDSTVLVDIITKMGYENIPLVFADTGLEYPEIREFVKTYGERVIWLKPKMNFRQVIEKYGYPIISKDISKRIYEWNNALKRGKDVTKTEAYKELMGKSSFTDGSGKTRTSLYNKEKWLFLTKAPFQISHKCCDIMKKNCFKTMSDKFPITAQMADESLRRKTNWLLYGCNAFDAKNPISNPMMFWTEQDVLEYIKTYELPICSVYGEVVTDYEGTDNIEGQMRFDDLSSDLWSDKLEQPKLKTTGCHRTGCMFCGYGCHREREGEGRFELMKETHPKQYEWIMKSWEQGGLGYKDVIDWINDHNGKGELIRY